MARMKKRSLIAVAVGALLLAGLFTCSVEQSGKSSEELLIQDVSRLLSVKVYDIQAHDKVEQLQNALQFARDNDLKVSISGSRHSQGGHAFYDDALVLDMTDFDESLALDQDNKILTVQSGATWKEIQAYLQPNGMALKTMQSSYVFTVGGSMSANIHGRDIEKTLIVEVIRSFRLLLANGEIVNVSRTENPELFALVIGGYGLFGVILDVELEVTEDIVLEKQSVIVDYADFEDYFRDNIKDNPQVVLHISRPSIAPSNLLEEIYVHVWKVSDYTEEDIFELRDEEHVWRDKFFFGLSRNFDWGKELRWYLQKKLALKAGTTRWVSTNNAMRPPTAPLAFLDHNSKVDTDIVQEYFIPMRNFVPWVDGMRKIVQEEDINVLNFTIRYVKQSDAIILSYTPNEESFAIVVFINQKLSQAGFKKAEIATQRMVDLAIENQGSYYLTYQLYPTRKQIRSAYPNIDLFFEKKLVYDPEERFMNKFYEKYALVADGQP